MKSISKNINSDISQKLFYLIVLFLFLRIDLVFLNNTPTGGDMGAHIVAIETLLKTLCQTFRLVDGQMTGLLDILYIISIFRYQQLLHFS